MPLVWVCEVPHLSQRFSVATAGNGAKAYRRLRLPDSAYLDSLLKDADVGFDPDAIPAVKSYTLIGLANIEQGHTFGSPLDIAPNPEADMAAVLHLPVRRLHREHPRFFRAQRELGDTLRKDAKWRRQAIAHAQKRRRAFHSVRHPRRSSIPDRSRCRSGVHA